MQTVGKYVDDTTTSEIIITDNEINFQKTVNSDVEWSLENTYVMVKAQCLWDVAIKMNSSTDSTNMLVTNLKPLYWALWPRW